jgi:O-antigen ligase
VFLAFSAILLVYFLLAVLSIKSMGFHFDMSSGDELSDRAARRLGRDVGYHRVDLSMMLSGASWAFIAFSAYFRQWYIKLVLCGASAIVLMGQAVTGGRTGYVTWGVLGLTLCLVRWRKLLPAIPLAIAVLIAFVPAVRERMFQGFAQNKDGMTEQTDASSITSGRTVIWPLVIDEIKESPVIGYGRIAMQRTGLSQQCLVEYGEVFGHPHNAYLEFLLDNGMLGFLVGMPLFALLLRRNFQLFRDRDDVIFEVAGGVGLCLLMALLIAGIGAQTFYPREGVVPMWAALAVALRVWVQREKAVDGEPIFPDNAAIDDGENLQPERFSYDR